MGLFDDDFSETPALRTTRIVLSAVAGLLLIGTAILALSPRVPLEYRWLGVFGLGFAALLAWTGLKVSSPGELGPLSVGVRLLVIGLGMLSAILGAFAYLEALLSMLSDMIPW